METQIKTKKKIHGFDFSYIQYTQLE